MSSFSWILLFLPLLCGYLGGKFLSHYYGFLGWIFGFVVGVIVSGLILSYTMNYIRKRFPIYPVCKNGKCTSDDYEIVEYDEKNSACVFRCKCGTKYLRCYSYFKEILPDGSLRPYMKTKHWGKWEIDEAVLCKKSSDDPNE